MCVDSNILCACGHHEYESMNNVCPCHLGVGKYYTTTEKCVNCGGEGKKGEWVLMEFKNEIKEEFEKQVKKESDGKEADGKEADRKETDGDKAERKEADGNGEGCEIKSSGFLVMLN